MCIEENHKCSAQGNVESGSVLYFQRNNKFVTKLTEQKKPKMSVLIRKEFKQSLGIH